MSSVQSTADSVRSGVGDALHNVIVYIPDFIAALVVLLFGVIVAYVLKAVIVRVLRMVKLGSMAKKTHLNDVFPGSFDVVELLGDLVKWFFIIVFLLQALTVAHLLQVGGLVQGLLNYVPSVVAAAVLVFVGGVVADLTSRIVMNAARAVGAGTARLLGDITRYSVLTLVVFTALAQLGVNTTFLNDLFVSIVAMLALAGGLAFGLGGRDLAKDILESLRSSFRKDV
jgi:hypothetical protein